MEKWNHDWESYEYTIDNSMYENDDNKMIEEITRDIISNAIDYINYEDCDNYEEHKSKINKDNGINEKYEDETVDDNSKNDSDEATNDSDEATNDSDDEILNDSEEATNDSDDDKIYKENGKKVLINCCSLYIVMLSVYVNAILCTYILFGC